MAYHGRDREQKQVGVCCLSKQEGLTLVELMVYMGLLGGVCLTVFPVLSFFLEVPQSWQKTVRLQREAQIFFQQFEREVQQSQQYVLENNKRIHFFDQHDQITYEKHGDVIRRQLNHEGHVVMCQFVREITFEPVTQQLFKAELTLEKEGALFHTERWIGLRAVTRE
ncbi:hypothetical protein GCM10010965_10560 [Caldalkalibacillus thermarum]|uniref:competence type IV pilus minor pilin ComGF n=1 Tax=Caldalkalibacillus thermarum TaxID=296745 RepID=UPI00166989EA|nr:competence type IV pilus minor pilin ComGF [Caldalkalibacillus thermarum]GGK19382.1 hypothetical protein GCM10010965_10560 [Caldalkalibacillus thermarum]